MSRASALVSTSPKPGNRPSTESQPNRILVPGMPKLSSKHAGEPSHLREPFRVTHAGAKIAKERGVSARPPRLPGPAEEFGLTAHGAACASHCIPNPI